AGDARYLRRLRAWGGLLSPGPHLEVSVWPLSGMASHGTGVSLPDISSAFLNQKAHQFDGLFSPSFGFWLCRTTKLVVGFIPITGCRRSGLLPVGGRTEPANREHPTRHALLRTHQSRSVRRGASGCEDRRS